MSPLKEIQTNNKILDLFIWAQKAGVLSILMPCFICYVFLQWIEQSRKQELIDKQRTEEENRKCTNNQIYLLTNQLEASTQQNKAATEIMRESNEANRQMLEYLEKHK